MSNAEILSAVLNRWVQPLIGAFVSGNMQSLPFIQAVENKVKSMGWVSPRWSLFSELSPVMEGITGNIVAPILNRYLSQVDDRSIPKLAHDIVDNALRNGELRILEGKVVFEKSDLEELKRLLDLNLPFDKTEEYEVKT